MTAFCLRHWMQPTAFTPQQDEQVPQRQPGKRVVCVVTCRLPQWQVVIGEEGILQLLRSTASCSITHLDGCCGGLEAKTDVAHPAEALALAAEELLVAEEDSGLLLEGLLGLIEGQGGSGVRHD